MTFQSFRKYKQDVNDTLYSKIIRYEQLRCWCCGKYRTLQCCHIMDRGYFTTRFMLTPARNAVPLCANCHQWLDKHKIKSLIFEPEKRVFIHTEESYTFLVTKCHYTWEDIAQLYSLSRLTGTYKYPWRKLAIKKYLTQELEKLERGSHE